MACSTWYLALGMTRYLKAGRLYVRCTWLSAEVTGQQVPDYTCPQVPSTHIFVRIRGCWSGMACRAWHLALGMTRYLKRERLYVFCTWLSTEVIRQQAPGYTGAQVSSPHIFVRIRGCWSGKPCRAWYLALGMTRYLKAGRLYVFCTWLSTEVIRQQVPGYTGAQVPSADIFVRIRGCWSGMACRAWYQALGMTRYLKRERLYVFCTWLSTEVIRQQAPGYTGAQVSSPHIFVRIRGCWSGKPCRAWYLALGMTRYLKRERLYVRCTWLRT